MLFRLSFSIFSLLAVCPFMVHSEEERAPVVDIGKLVEKAKKGDAEAQYEVGLVRRDGSEDLKKSARKALKLFEKAALQGHTQAMFALGVMHRHGGKGVRMNSETAIHWLKEAGKEGNARANLNVGQMILNEEVQNHDQSAKHFYELAANAGLADAEFELGHMHFYGEGSRNNDLCQGTPKNSKDALHWYTKAAKQGHPKAQFCLGNLLLNGAKGIDKNRAEAKEWYTKAAEQSFMEAMFTLGNVIYEDSNQEYDDLVKVHAWWNKAVLRGHDKAADAVKNIEYKMKLLEKDMPKKEPEPEEDEGKVHDDNPENVASSGSAGGYVPKSSSHRYRNMV